MTTILERKFQSYLIEKLKDLFPGCIILKNDPNLTQGIPDLIILYYDKWAALEVKSFKNAKTQPNQKYWINLLSKLSYANFIYPENEKEVLYELQQAFRS